MENCAISRWDDPNEINARLKTLTSQPIWEVDDEYYNGEIMKYYDEKCKASSERHEEETYDGIDILVACHGSLPFSILVEEAERANA